ncbi:MAG: tripartite tricarboxylate transporter TctB family protein [Thermodesulfobacteriota bacterium]
MKMRGSSRGELAVYGAAGLVALSIIRPSLEMGLGGGRELGPGLMPFLAALVVLATGGALVVLTFVRNKPVPFRADGEEPGLRKWLRVLLILGGLAGWPLLASGIGYVIPTFLVSLCTAKATGYPGWRGPLVLSAGVALGIWVLFSQVFSTDLPGGFFL